MSTVKTNRIENNAGTHSLSVDDIGYPLSTAWGGTLLTALTTPTLASVGIVGLNPIAYVYPDGTIVGESDNGSFTKWANGELECIVTENVTTNYNVFSTVYSNNSSDLYYPIVFIGQNPSVIQSSIEDGTGTQQCWAGMQRLLLSRLVATRIILYTTNNNNTKRVYAVAKGRWK